MIQGRGGARFELEPLERLLVVARQILRQKLQRHALAEVQVFYNQTVPMPLAPDNKKSAG